MSAQNKVPWWKQALAWVMGEDWQLDPYKIAAFVLLWKFSQIMDEIMVMVSAKPAIDVALVGIAAGVLATLATMITFLFNYSKEHDRKLLDAAKEQ